MIGETADGSLFITPTKRGATGDRLTSMIRCSRARLARPHWPLLLLLILLVLSGCIRREGRNSDCQWPRRPEPKAHAINLGNLRADLEFAEELAIRYMDAHYGPRNPEAAAQAKNRCMGVRLGEIGKEHGITAQEAFKFFGQRSAAVDLAMNLPFILVYALAGDFAIRCLLGRDDKYHYDHFSFAGLRHRWTDAGTTVVKLGRVDSSWHRPPQ